MSLSTQLIRRNLYAQVVALAALIILLPVNGFTTPQKDDPREHPPKLLNYSKMTTRQLVDEGEKIIFGGLGLAKVQGAVGRGQCTLCHATREGQLGDRAGGSSTGPNGTTANASIAVNTEIAGAIRNSTLSTCGGMTSSFSSSLMPSAKG